MKNLENSSNRIEASIGQHIKDFAQQLIDIANYRNEEVTGTFSGIELTVDPSSDVTVDSLLNHFSEESERRAEAYRNSPEGIKAAQEAEERKNNMQEKADELVSRLSSLDFSDYETVLDWICDFQEASDDRIGVSYDRTTVISIFKEHGYDIGVNTGDDFNGENAENFAKYLVGQALDGIQSVGAPHQIVHKFTNDWKQKFSKKVESDNNRINKIRESLN